MLEAEGIGFLYLFGEMKKKQRAEATQRFRDDPEIKVLVGNSARCSPDTY